MIILSTCGCQRTLSFWKHNSHWVRQAFYRATLRFRISLVFDEQELVQLVIVQLSIQEVPIWMPN